MTYALIKNNTVSEYPVYEGDIRLRFPNTSFTIPFEPPSGYAEVADVLQPVVDYTQNVTEGIPVLVDGTWTRHWVVTDASPEQIADRTASKAQEVRADRNRRLSECDWTQLPDAPVDHAAWAAYRQALRDVSSQPGFPWNVQWPVVPS